MTGWTLLRAVVTAALFAYASAGPAAAASAVTFVSGNGRNTGDCTRAAPCRTFAYAIPKTAAGGVVAALDPSGYGPTMTIDKSITILGPGRGAAAMSPSSANGNVGVDINAPGGTIVLRGLEIDGGYDGIRITQAASVVISDTVITGSSNLAIDMASSLGGASVLVQDTTVRNAEVDNYAANFVAKRLTVSGSPGAGLFSDLGHAVLDDCTVSGSANVNLSLFGGTTIIKHGVAAYGTAVNGAAGGITFRSNATAYIDSTTTSGNSPLGVKVNGTAFSYGNNNFPDGTEGTITPIAGD